MAHQSTIVSLTGKGTNPKTTLYVGGLEENVTQEILHAAFIPFGEVKDVSIPLDHASGTNRGFGFVDFELPEDAADAIDNMHNGGKSFVCMHPEHNVLLLRGMAFVAVRQLCRRTERRTYSSGPLPRCLIRRAVRQGTARKLRPAHQDQGRGQGLGIPGCLGRRGRLVGNCELRVHTGCWDLFCAARVQHACLCGNTINSCCCHCVTRKLSYLDYPRYERADAEQQLEQLEEKEAKAAERAALTKAAGLDAMEAAEAGLEQQ